jgi:hypothetical protein
MFILSVSEDARTEWREEYLGLRGSKWQEAGAYCIVRWATCVHAFKVFYLPTDAQYICFKRILKFTLKQLLHISV